MSIKIDVDSRRDNKASQHLFKNEGSIMQTCQNINAHVLIYVEAYMNIYGLHKLAIDLFWK